MRTNLWYTYKVAAGFSSSWRTLKDFAFLFQRIFSVYSVRIYPIQSFGILWKSFDERIYFKNVGIFF